MPCVTELPCVTEQKNPAWKALQARSQCPRKVTYFARTPLRPYVRRATEGIHCDRRLSPPTPSSASPGLASLSTHPGAALGGLDTHGVAGGSCT